MGEGQVQFTSNFEKLLENFKTEVAAVNNPDEKLISNLNCTYLSQGSFGVVELCNMFKPIIARKTVQINDSARAELEFMKNFCSNETYKDYFCRLMFYSVTDSQLVFGLKAYTMTLENFCKIRTLNIHEYIVYIHQQISNCLDTLHKLNYVHLDIKPANILMDVTFANQYEIQSIVLADFGLISKKDDESINTPTSGTPLYLLPQNANVHHDITDYAIFRDKWAWALSLYSIIFKKHLIEHKDINELMFSTYQFVRSTDLQQHKINEITEVTNKNNFSKLIIRFIIEQINNLKKFYAPTSGGKPATIRIKFNNKIYIVRVNKVIGKYIVIAAQKVALTQIRGRYRYVT